VIDIVGASSKAGAGLEAHTQKTSGTDSQLWEVSPDPAGSGYYYILSKLNQNAIDIEGASVNSGALLDAFTQKWTSADNQLWEFVSDPAGSGYYFIVSKLTGTVIDVQGASTKSGALLDVFPLEVSDYDNQLWQLVDGDFPSVVKTVPAPSKGLASNYNYLLYNDSNNLLDVSVAMDVTDDIVFESASGSVTGSETPGFSFQLNCYSPPIMPPPPPGTPTTVVQQYVVELSGTQLVWGINNYDTMGTAEFLLSGNLG
jgi:Ricin-type beta-trefoil lectin domain-like